MMRRCDVEKKVKEIIVRKLRLKGGVKKITSKTALKNDLGIGYEGLVDLIMAVDKKFEVIFRDGDDVYTLKDIVDCIMEKLKKKEKK
jgi:acyl carrier protein